MAAIVEKRAAAILYRDPDLAAIVGTGWRVIETAIHDRAAAQRPVPKVFEVHHECETARLTYLAAIVAEVDPVQAARVACERIGLQVDGVTP